MPRNTRNFWIELDVDGKKSRVATGPRSKDGGFAMTIYIRENGQISLNELRVSGRADANGNLKLDAQLFPWNYTRDANMVSITTKR